LGHHHALMCSDCRTGHHGTDLGDAFLLGQIAARCRDAYAQFYMYYAPRLVSWFMARGMTEAEATEAAQEVMLCVWRDARSFTFELGTPSAWVVAMARQVFTMELRTGAFVAAERQPIEQYDTEGAARRVRAAMAALRPDVARVIVAVLHHGLSHYEAARRLGLPLGTTKSHLARGVARLRSALRRQADRGSSE
jgi:RNA polymerase sigma-70 factor (ECF subfamily)